MKVKSTIICDKDSEFAEYLAAELKKHQIKTQTVLRGRDLFRSVKETKPETIILSQELPDMEGCTALTEIKNIFPEIQVIMTSSAAETRMESFAADLGAFEIINKPLNTENLIKSLNKAAAKRASVLYSDNKGNLKKYYKTDSKKIDSPDKSQKIDTLISGDLYMGDIIYGLKLRKLNADRIPLEKINFIVADTKPDVLILNFKNGIKALGRIKIILRKNPLLKVIVLTREPSLQTAMAVIEEGAFDYLMPPYGIDDIASRARDAVRATSFELKKMEQKTKINNAYYL